MTKAMSMSNPLRVAHQRFRFQLNGPEADLARITLAAADHELKR